MSDTKMSDTKFLGLCIILAALMISSTIIWSTKISRESVDQSSKDIPLSATPAQTVQTVQIQGPVQLAPFSGPVPVTISNTPDSPLPVKDVSVKTWTR